LNSRYNSTISRRRPLASRRGIAGTDPDRLPFVLLAHGDDGCGAFAVIPDVRPDYGSGRSEDRRRIRRRERAVSRPGKRRGAADRRRTIEPGAGGETQRCAFANAHGGTLPFGGEDDGAITGRDSADIRTIDARVADIGSDRVEEPVFPIPRNPILYGLASKLMPSRKIGTAVRRARARYPHIRLYNQEAENRFSVVVELPPA